MKYFLFLLTFLTACTSNENSISGGGATSTTENARTILINIPDELLESTITLQGIDSISSDTLTVSFKNSKVIKYEYEGYINLLSIKIDNFDSTLISTQLNYNTSNEALLEILIYKGDGSSDFTLQINQLNNECESSLVDIRCGSFIDNRDQNLYEWIQIDSTRWFSRNLNFNDFREGIYTGVGDYAPFKSDSVRYGNYYTWNSLFNSNNIQDLCPVGWHVPTERDWNNLEKYSNYDSKMVKSKTEWDDSDTSYDQLLLNIYPAGYRDVDGEFKAQSETARLWSAEAPTDSTAWDRNFKSADSLFSDVERDKNQGLSIRCISKVAI